MPSRESQTRAVRETVAPFLDEGETLMRAAEAMKGPSTFWSAMLGPIGYFLLQRPRHVGLTGARLVVAIPPARRGGTRRLDVAVEREGLEVVEFSAGRLWTRLVLRAADGRRIPLNFARIWRSEAQFLHRKLGGSR